MCVVSEIIIHIRVSSPFLPTPFFFQSFLLRTIQFQFSRSVVSDSLWPHELQHARPHCPSPTPGVYPNSCPWNWWCYLTISSSVIPFSSRLQSFPTSGSFQMSQLFASGGQSIGASASVNDSDLWIPLYFMSHFRIRTELHVANFPPILFPLKAKLNKANFLGLLPVTYESINNSPKISSPSNVFCF